MRRTDGFLTSAMLLFAMIVASRDSMTSLHKAKALP